MSEQALREARWELDEYATLNLRFQGPHGEVHAFIDQRPAYCDRGHWRFGVMHGVPSLDSADSFPRYYMSLETAIAEAERWLMWRLYKVANVPRPIPLALQMAQAHGRQFGEGL